MTKFRFIQIDRVIAEVDNAAQIPRIGEEVLLEDGNHYRIDRIIHRFKYDDQLIDGIVSRVRR